jgi:hypothetical protein
MVNLQEKFRKSTVYSMSCGELAETIRVAYALSSFTIRTHEYTQYHFVDVEENPTFSEDEILYIQNILTRNYSEYDYVNYLLAKLYHDGMIEAGEYFIY